MKTLIPVLKFLFLAALLAACAKSPQVAPLGVDDVVLAFGDSLTFGSGALPSESYPAQLQLLINRRVVNGGVPGEISADAILRLPLQLEEVHPKLLILCHGGNDFLRKLDENAAAANIGAMVRLARNAGVDVVLLATPKPGLLMSPPDFYAQLAKQFAIPIDDGVLKSVLRDNELKSDLIHPNARGYAQIAQAVSRLLKKAGAI